MADVLATAATFDNAAQAEIARIALEQAEIKAAVYDLRGNRRQFRVQVLEADLERAQTVLAQASRG